MIISISDMKKNIVGEAKQDNRDSTQTPMYINLFDIYQQKLNIADTKSDIQFDFRQFIQDRFI